MIKGLRKTFSIILVMLLMAGVGTFSACGGGGSDSSDSNTDNTVTITNLNPASPGYLSLNQDLTISFNYKTAETAGAVIFIRPFTGGSLTPSYAASLSPLYPEGSGSGTSTFHLSAGTNVHIDHLRIQMFNSDQSELLFETLVAVNYTVNTNSVSITNLNPASPGYLLLNQDVTMSFSYNTLETGGARIFFMPMTEGGETPNYSGGGSPLYALGSGTGTRTFRITAGTNVHIDQLRIRMYNEDQSELLLETYLAVDYTVNTNSVTVTNLNPASPGNLLLHQNLTISINYNTLDAGGVYIYIRPFTNGSLTPSYAASMSPLYPVGAGSVTATFRIDAGTNVPIDQLRIQMYDSTQSTKLFEEFVNVDYTVN
jgi:hypothetical protein